MLYLLFFTSLQKQNGIHNRMRFRLLIILFLLSGVCAAQSDSTATEFQDSTLDKNLIDKVMDLFEFNHGRTSIKCYPTMGIDPASGISFGLLSLVAIEPKERDRKKIKFYRPTSISNSLSYSTKNWINLRSDMIIYASHGVVVNTLLQYQISPDKYYGIGNDTLNTDPVKFDMNDLRFSGNVSKELSSTCYLGFQFDLSYRDCASLGENAEGLDLPERKNNWLFGFGPHFTFDRRDNINYPMRGEFCTFGFKYFPHLANDTYSFYCVELDVRKFFTIYKDLVLACQLFSGISEGDIPFYCMYQLGGQTRMRGISNKYMYIDKNAYFAQTELRKHIWKRFSVVAFGGVGNTYARISEMFINQIKYVFGAGIRFQSDTKNNINVRLDYGRGSFGDSGMYVTCAKRFNM